MPNKQPRLFLPRTLIPWADHPNWLRADPGERAWIQTGQGRVPLTVVSDPPWLAKPRRPGEGVTLFVTNRSTRTQRESLEREGASYVDVSGYLHVVAPSVLVHVERRFRGHRALPSSSIEPMRLGPAATRVAMAMLIDPGELAIAPLAKRASASVGQTHQTLRLLEEAGFVRRVGQGPQTRRSLANRSAVADLLRETVLRQRRPQSFSGFVYARKPAELWEKLTTTLGDQAVLSGAAAAAVLGAPSSSATSIPRTTVRIASDLLPDEAWRRLGAEPAQSGANVSLVVDKARWGAVSPGTLEGIRVANPVCIWLDCLREPRGEDVAQQFREKTLGY